MNRREIEAMFRLSAIKQTRVYQEALEAERVTTVRRWLGLGLSNEQSALGTGLSVERVGQSMESDEREPHL
jgi:predicted transposase YdaD